MIWRPGSERAGRGVRAVSAGPGSGGGARLPVRARAGRGVPHQAVAQAARVTRPRGREGGRAGRAARHRGGRGRSEIGRAHAELQSLAYLVCRLLLEKKKKKTDREISAQ